MLKSIHIYVAAAIIALTPIAYDEFKVYQAAARAQHVADEWAAGAEQREAERVQLNAERVRVERHNQLVRKYDAALTLCTEGQADYCPIAMETAIKLMPTEPQIVSHHPLTIDDIPTVH